jgi:hypothetical protein
MTNNVPKKSGVVEEADISELEMLAWRVWWALYEPTFIMEAGLSEMLGDGPNKVADFNDLKGMLLEALLEDPRVISAQYVNGTFQIETIVGPISCKFPKTGRDE